MTDSVADTLRALRSQAHLLPDAHGAEDSAARGIFSAPSDGLWEELDGHLPHSLAGRRVLVLGPGTERVARGFAAQGAAQVLLCQTSGDQTGDSLPGAAQAAALEVDRLPWSALDPALHGTFHIVHCHHMLERVPEPVSLLHALRDVTAPGGTLLCRLLMLADPERSEYLRYVPDRLAEDPDVWFVPGRLAVRWLLQEAGFAVQAEFGRHAGPSDRFQAVIACLKCVRD